MIFLNLPERVLNIFKTVVDGLLENKGLIGSRVRRDADLRLLSDQP